MHRVTSFNLRYFTGIDDYFLIDGFYPFSNNSINEAYGVPDFLMSVTAKIINEIISLKSLSNNSFSKILSINVSSICKYFDNIFVSVNYIKDSSSTSGAARYIPGNFAKSNDIEIEISIIGPKLDPVKIGSYLYHEILHAYEDKLLYMKYNISIVKKMQRDSYGLWLHIIENKDLVSYETLIFAYIMYYLNKEEMNANIVQIEAECSEFIERVSSSVEANKLFKETPSYKKMKTIEQRVYEIDTMSEYEENEIIFDINSLVRKDGLSFTKKDFNIFKKQLMSNWSKYQRKFRINASKIINKLFQMKSYKKAIY